MALATEQGKQHALKELETRRANKPERIDDAKLPAGAPMHFYCKTCGWLSDKLPEMYTCTPKKLCAECEALQELGWLE